MNEYFNWSKVYSVSHTQGSYLIFTVAYGRDAHAGVMLPAAMDDIWNIAGSRLIEKISSQVSPASSDEEVLCELNAWISQNLKGKYTIEPVDNMYPPLEFEGEA